MHNFYVTASVVHNVDTVTNTIQAFSQDDDDDSQEKGMTSFCYVYICILEIYLQSVFLLTDSFRWPHEAILLLLRIYTDNEHHLTSGKTHKKFWGLVSSQLIANGYNVTDIQCKSKMSGLKNTYKNIKDHNAKSVNSRRTWRYFDVSRMNRFYKKYISFSIKTTLYVVSIAIVIFIM